MDQILGGILNAIADAVAERITNKIARVFNIKEDTTSWRNIHAVISLVVGLGIVGMILLLLFLLAKQYGII